MDSLDNLLLKIEKSQNKEERIGLAEKFLTGSLGSCFSKNFVFWNKKKYNYYFNNQIRDILMVVSNENSEILYDINRLRKAYQDTELKDLVLETYKTFLLGDELLIKDEIYPMESMFVDYLIEIKENLCNYVFAKKILRRMQEQILNFTKGFADDETTLGLLDDDIWKVLNPLKDILSYRDKDSLQLYMKIREIFMKNRNPISQITRIAETIRRDQCKSDDEICEVASLDLPEGYKPIKKLGKGGSGSVYLVENTVDGLEEAVKILELDSSKGSPEDIRRAIESELKVRRLNKLRCPYITMYYSVVHHNGKFIISMEPYEKTLEERMDEVKGRLSFSEAIKYYTQLSRTLGVCHRLGIVHKDLAPHNIGIDSEGDIKLSDFGDPLTTIDKRNKQPPLDYSSPRLLALPEGILEVLQADNVFALGVMLYEMLTGELPFSDPNMPRENRKQRKEYILKKQQEMKEKGVDALLKNISIDEKEADEYINAQYDPRVQWEYGINLHSLENHLKYAIEKLFEGEDLIKISLIEI